MFRKTHVQARPSVLHRMRLDEALPLYGTAQKRLGAKYLPDRIMDAAQDWRRGALGVSPGQGRLQRTNPSPLPLRGLGFCPGHRTGA